MDAGTIIALATLILGSNCLTSITTVLVTHRLGRKGREVSEAVTLVAEYRQFIEPLKAEIHDLRGQVERLGNELEETILYIKTNGHTWPKPPAGWAQKFGNG